MIAKLSTLWVMANEGATEAVEQVAQACDPAQFGGGVPTPGCVQPNDVTPANYWMPISASDNTDSVDWLFYGILGLSVFCFVAITVAVVYFTWRYRHRPGHKREESSAHNDALEITWTVIPSIICVFIFIAGWRGFVDLFTPPKHAFQVKVTAAKWNWSFEYPDYPLMGSTDVLHVPQGEAVVLVMKSTDVLHSLFVPAFRVKQDVIPNRYTRVWFKATKPGLFRLTCAEYCGADHSYMKTWVQVHPPGRVRKFLDEEQERRMDLEPVELGKLMYENKGCPQCHSLDGTANKGPSFKGLWGTQERLADGSTVTVDEDYIRESILDPAAKVVSGFTPVMPTFRGQLSEKHIDGIIEFIKAQK